MKLGILGGGQLARMMLLAAARLGVRCNVWEHDGQPATKGLAQTLVAPFHEYDNIAAFAAGLDAATFEFENVPAGLVAQLETVIPTFPPSGALRVTQDRLMEKRLFESLGFPTPAFVPIDTFDELKSATETIGLPGVLKTRRFGYDGKGQAVLREPADIQRVWDTLTQGGASVPSMIYERFVPFARELSILGVRGRGGEARFYPLVENHHHEGILRLTLAPGPKVSPELQQRAESLCATVMSRLNYVGVMAIELFHEPGTPGELVANEIAPRVHNSGHWTMDGATTCQFENHVRAVLGLPLGDTSPRSPTAMLNIIGQMPTLSALCAVEGLRVHLYAKSERPGRKIGHVNIVAATEADLRARLTEISHLGLPGIRIT